MNEIAPKINLLIEKTMKNNGDSSPNPHYSGYGDENFSLRIEKTKKD